MLYTYDDSQLAEIRKIIAGLARLTPDDIAVRDTAVADGEMFGGALAALAPGANRSSIVVHRGC